MPVTKEQIRQIILGNNISGGLIIKYLLKIRMT